LPTIGIIGAAAMSTIAYTVVFVVMLRFISSEPTFSLARAFSVRRLVSDGRSLIRSAVTTGRKRLESRRGIASAEPAEAADQADQVTTSR
jgi:hypothetical protein